LKFGKLREFRLEKELDQHWVSWAFVAWALVCAFFIYTRYGNIYWLALGDTDDNMRLMQVRGLLHGQGWYDLRQYRLDPALGGLDIHWSRFVDLPIAGLILLLKPFIGNAMAERWACGLAPLIPLLITMWALGMTVRRLIDPKAWPVALLVLMGCTSTMLMYAPERIDHHGWQLACLALTVAGLADPRRARGGATVGLSSALSLTIGLEMLPYCAMAGAILTLRWVWGAAEAKQQAALEAGALFGEDVIVPRRPRDVGLMVYGLTLSGGSCLGFAIFGSYANMAMRCDALTPVWLTVMIAGGVLLFGLAMLNPADRWVRLALGVAAAAVIAGGFAWLFPQCLGRPEQASPELVNTWLANVREARPIYKHPLATAFPIAALPVIGVIGACFATWRWRNSPSVIGWAAVALFTTIAGLMLLWQVRAGPAAQMLAVPGSSALVWILIPWFMSRRWLLVRVLGSTAAFLLVSGLFAGYVVQYLPAEQKGRSPGADKTGAANAACARVSTLIRLNAIPTATMFTHVDLGPRLITITHHNGIAGPYHRNERQILDVHHAFTGAPEAFRPIAAAHKAKYLLICPDMAETTVYRARNQYGFYGQLHRGRVPHWLEPVELPKNSPFRLWTIRYDLPDEPAGFWIKPPVRKAPPPAVEAPKLPVKK
jgi:hypothetical protein